MSNSSLVERADAYVSEALASWNLTSTVLCALLLAYLVYPLFIGKEPDIHPYLLARQATTSPIRQNGQSSVYRAIEIPYGYPLRGGLGVKDAGTPRWSSGRDGDLRDIWRRAAQGPTKDDGTPDGSKGKIVTVLGREKVVEHSFEDLTRGINAIGSHFKQLGAKRIGICLANSVEQLQSIFGSAFHGSQPILIPFGLQQDQLTELIVKAAPDVLIAEAGVLELKSVVSACSSLKQVIWVTQAGSEHMNWGEVPEDMKGDFGVSVWKDLISDKGASSEVPAVEKDSEAVSISTFWPTYGVNFELVEYSSKNLVSGIAALNATIPRAHRLAQNDLVLPLVPLWLSYSLCTTLAALYNNASLALNSVAGDSVDVELASQGIKPTVILCSTLTALKLHTKTSELYSSALAPLHRILRGRTLKSGNLPSSRLASLATSPLSNLRLLLLAHRLGDLSSPTLSSNILTDLRIYPGVHIGYALTTGAVAGAIAQTNVLDYRHRGAESHFGAPLSCVEVLVVGDEDDMAAGGPAAGKLVVRGPAVVGGEVRLDATATFNDDHTLSLA